MLVVHSGTLSFQIILILHFPTLPGCQADSSEFRQQLMEALERLRRKVAGKA